MAREHRVATPHGHVAAVDFGGDGPDLVLLHGATRTLADWGMVREHISGRRVVGVDFRWHGRSSDKGDVTIESSADDVEAVIASLGLDNPAVAGHSLGGMVAAVYGERHPEAPGVSNVDGHGSGTPDQYDGMERADVEAFQQRLLDLQAAMVPSQTSGDDAWHKEQVDGMRTVMSAMGIAEQHGNAILERTYVLAKDGLWHTRPSPLYAKPMIEMVKKLKLFDLYRRVDCPLVIYNCLKNQPLPVEGAEEMMSAYRRGLGNDLAKLAAERPNVTVRTMQDATHMVIAEVPAEIAEHLMALTP